MKVTLEQIEKYALSLLENAVEKYDRDDDAGVGYYVYELGSNYPDGPARLAKSCAGVIEFVEQHNDPLIDDYDDVCGSAFSHVIKITYTDGNDYFLKVKGEYNSWNGLDTDNIKVTLVTPTQKTITVYE